MNLAKALRDFFASEKEVYSLKSGNTTYNISRKGTMSYLKANGIVYSQLDSSSIFTNSYHDKFALLPLLYKHPSVLVIGICGGTIPYQLNKLYGKLVSIDAIDTNRHTSKLAKKFLPDSRINFRIIIGKGNEYVEKCSHKYDLIIQDAFVSDHIPDSFLEDRFMAAAYAALKPEGILAINFAPEVMYLPIYMHNLRKHFRYVYKIHHIHFGNYIIICSKEFNKRQIIEKIELQLEITDENRALFNSYKSM